MNKKIILWLIFSILLSSFIYAQNYVNDGNFEIWCDKHEYKLIEGNSYVYCNITKLQTGSENVSIDFVLQNNSIVEVDDIYKQVFDLNVTEVCGDYNFTTNITTYFNCSHVVNTSQIVNSSDVVDSRGHGLRINQSLDFNITKFYTIKMYTSSSTSFDKFWLIINSTVTGLTELDPDVSGCDDSDPNIFICADGTFSGNTINTNKSIIISNATINGNGYPAGSVEINTTENVTINNSIINGWGGNASSTCTPGGNGTFIVTNANTLNIHDSIINIFGGLSNGGSSACTDNHHGGKVTLEFNVTNVIINNVTVNGIGGKAGDKGGAYDSGGHGGYTYTYIYADYLRVNNSNFYLIGGNGSTVGDTGAGYGGYTKLFLLIGDINIIDSNFYYYGGHGGNAGTLYGGAGGFTNTTVMSDSYLSFEDFNLDVYGGKSGNAGDRYLSTECGNTYFNMTNYKTYIYNTNISAYGGDNGQGHIVAGRYGGYTSFSISSDYIDYWNDVIIETYGGKGSIETSSGHYGPGGTANTQFLFGSNVVLNNTVVNCHGGLAQGSTGCPTPGACGGHAYFSIYSSYDVELDNTNITCYGDTVGGGTGNGNTYTNIYTRKFSVDGICELDFDSTYGNSTTMFKIDDELTFYENVTLTSKYPVSEFGIINITGSNPKLGLFNTYIPYLFNVYNPMSSLTVGRSGREDQNLIFYDTYSNVSFEDYFNTAPEAQNVTLNSSDGTNNTYSDLQGFFDYYDADGNPQTDNQTKWYKNNNEQTDLENLTIINSGNTTVGDIWIFSVRVYDGEDWSEWVNSSSLTIINNIPEVQNIILNSSDGTNNTYSDLQGFFNYYDIDGDFQIDNQTKWYKNNNEQTDLENLTIINSGNTTVEDIWIFSVRVYDGYEWSGWVNSSSLTIINNIPEVQNVVLNSSDGTNSSYSNLQGFFSYYDIDGDIEVNNQTSWYKNSVEQTDLENLTIINSGNTTVGDMWIFSVRVYDGYEWSEWVNSSSLTIIDIIAPIWTDNQTNVSTRYNDFVWFSINWTDDVGVDYSIFSWNGSSCGAMENVSILDCQGNLSCIHNITKTINCTRDEQVCWKFYANDTSNNWNQTDTWCFTVENTEPVFDEDLVNQTINHNQSIFNYDINCSDIDGDIVTYYLNSNLSTLSINQSGYINGIVNITYVGSWYLNVSCDDNLVNISQMVYINVTNTMPNTNDVDLTSSDPLNRTNGTLIGSFTYYDIDGDIQNKNETRWYKDNVEQTNLENLTIINSGNTTVWEDWIFSARVFDGYEWSEWVNSTILTVINIIPETQNILLVSSDALNRTNGTLTGSFTYYDEDSHIQNMNETKWYRNDTEQTNLVNLTTILSGNTSKSDVWIFSARVNDGYNWSSWVNSSLLIVENTLPVYNYTNITPSIAYTNNTLQVNITPSDVDNDILTIWVDWFVNNVLTWWEIITGVVSGTTTQSNMSSGNFSHFDNITVQLTVGDDVGNTTIQNTSILYINNTKPLTQNIILTSSDPFNRTNGTLTGSFTYYDIDSDAQNTNETRWYKDGVEQVGLANSITILSGNTSKNDVWIFSARVNDGYDWSEWINSSDMVIQNTNSVINSYNTVPPTIYYNTSFYIETNVTDLDNDISYVNFSLFYPNNTLIYNNNGTVSSDIWTSQSYLPTINGTWLWYINVSDTSSALTSTSGTFFIPYVINSNVSNTNITGNSNIVNSTLNNSYIDNSNISNSIVINSTVVNCTVLNTTLFNSVCVNSYINNSIITNSTVQNSTLHTTLNLSNGNVTDDYFYSGVIIYNGMTFTIPQPLDYIYYYDSPIFVSYGFDRTSHIYGYNVTIYANITILSPVSSIVWANLTLTSPNGTAYINNQNMSYNGTYWVSNFVINETGTKWTAQIVTSDTEGDTNSKSFETGKVTNVVNKFPTRFKAAPDPRNETQIVNLTMYTNSYADRNFTFSCAMDLNEGTWFNTVIDRTSALIGMNNYNESNKFNNQLTIYILNYNIPDSEYTGVCNITDQFDGTVYKIDISLGINPPSGQVSAYTQAGVLCTGDICNWNQEMEADEIKSVTWRVKNDGNFTLSNCIPSISGIDFDSLTPGTQYYFDKSSFSVGVGNYTTLTLTVNSPSSGIYYGELEITCEATDYGLYDSLSSRSDNVPKVKYLSVTALTDPVTKGGSGGGASPIILYVEKGKPNCSVTFNPTVFTLTQNKKAILVEMTNNHESSIIPSFSVSDPNMLSIRREWTEIEQGNTEELTFLALTFEENKSKQVQVTIESDQCNDMILTVTLDDTQKSIIPVKVPAELTEKLFEKAVLRLPFLGEIVFDKYVLIILALLLSTGISFGLIPLSIAPKLSVLNKGLFTILITIGLTMILFSIV